MYSARPPCKFDAPFLMPARANCIDIDIVTSNIGIECSRETDYPHLRGSIRRPVGKWLFACPRTKVYDFPVPLTGSFRVVLPWQQRNCESRLTASVRFPFRQSHIPDILGRTSDTNNVSQYINASQSFNRFLHHLVHLLLFRDISLKTQSLSTSIAYL